MQLAGVRKQWNDSFHRDPNTIAEVTMASGEKITAYLGGGFDNTLMLHPPKFASTSGQPDASVMFYKPLTSTLIFLDGADIRQIKMELTPGAEVLDKAGYKPLGSVPPPALTTGGEQIDLGAEAARPPPPVVQSKKMPRVVMLPDDAPIPEGARVLQGEVVS